MCGVIRFPDDNMRYIVKTSTIAVVFALGVVLCCVVVRVSQDTLQYHGGIELVLLQPGLLDDFRCRC